MGRSPHLVVPVQIRSTPVPLPPPDQSSIALVTGASSGIGEEFARQLHGRGYRVALVARRADRLERLAAELSGDGQAIAIGADLAVPGDRDRIVAKLEELGTKVEVLVNNAGFGVYSSFAESDRELELRQVRVNVEAVVDLIARYLPGMVSRGRGAIINMASTSGLAPLPYNAGYSAAKGHVLLLSEAINAEVKTHGVSVTAVCPGPVPTEFQEANDAAFAERLPKPLWVDPARVVADALAAADKGRRAVIPGGPAVKAFFGPIRWAPTAVRIAVAKRLMAR
jgi:short-subunit dehydrogenase